ncbi:MAG TPA: hypothetical protein VHU15_12960 [Stellaceae bacterium]|jgi:hypothetical protein|nr:hypothetical protein [Stellaceae bacterium]
MRQPPLLRWIEQAEARRVADAAFHERIMLTSPEFQRRATPMVRRDRSRRLFAPMTLLRRWRPSRIANDIC